MEQRRTVVREVKLTAQRERRTCRWLGFHRSAVRYVVQNQHGLQPIIDFPDVERVYPPIRYGRSLWPDSEFVATQSASNY